MEKSPREIKKNFSDGKAKMKIDLKSGEKSMVKRSSTKKSPKGSPKKTITRSPSKTKKTIVIEQENSPSHRRVKPTMNRKSPKRTTDRVSPTRRMIQMKNAYIKNQKKAHKDPDNQGKMVYTISPDEGYIVNQEFFDEMRPEDLVKKSEELCKTADKQRANEFGDSMMKHHHKAYARAMKQKK